MGYSLRSLVSVRSSIHYGERGVYFNQYNVILSKAGDVLIVTVIVVADGI